MGPCILAAVPLAKFLLHVPSINRGDARIALTGYDVGVYTAYIGSDSAFSDVYTMTGGEEIGLIEVFKFFGRCFIYFFFFS